MASSFEQIVAALHAQLADATLPYGVMRLAQSAHAHARRVVWVPTTFTTEGVPHVNPIKDENGLARVAIYQERWEVECHITGLNFTDAEEIRGRILNLVRLEMRTGSQPTSGVWVSQGAAEAEFMAGGTETVIQRFTWAIRVLEPLQQQVVVEGVEMSAPTP